MRAELLQLAADLAARSEPFVLAVVVRRRPASSAQAGDMALITAAGAFHGWLGGSCTQPTVVREAQKALADGKPRLLSLSPDPEAERRPGVAVFPMTCHSGGSVEIYLEPVLPVPCLTVFGVSPAARALVKLGKAMGYRVEAADAAAEPALFPEADRVLTDLSEVAAAGAGQAAERYAVVATMGERDEEAIQAALAAAPAYLGVVASARRFAQLRATLLAQGVAAEELDGIESPAGVDIGAHTPEEIALSVLAAIVQRRRAMGASDAAAETAASEAAASAPAPAAGEAIDPICGMTVAIAGARHVAEHAGRTFYFCCAGCRTRFLAAPESYLEEVAQGGAA